MNYYMYCKIITLFNLTFITPFYEDKIKQGGSVMCVCTLSSDPAYLHFSLNCLPNEEEIKKINTSTYRSTNF